MLIKEETLEKEVRHLIDFLAEYIKILFKQIGKVVDIASFNMNSSYESDDTFELGPYSIIGFSLILTGLYFIITLAKFFPSIEIMIIFLLISLIGIFLYLK